MNESDDSFEFALRRAINAVTPDQNTNLAALARRGEMRGRIIRRRRLISITLIATMTILITGLFYIVTSS